MSDFCYIPPLRAEFRIAPLRCGVGTPDRGLEELDAHRIGPMRVSRREDSAIQLRRFPVVIGGPLGGYTDFAATTNPQGLPPVFFRKVVVANLGGVSDEEYHQGSD